MARLTLAPPPEARRLAAELLAHYPAAFVTEAHINAIAGDLAREGLDIADDVIALLRLRCRTVPNGADIHDTAREVRKETMSPRMDLGYDMPRSAFSLDHWQHGKYHLAALLALPKEERTDEMRVLAQHPEQCTCDKRISASVGAEEAYR